MYHPGGNSQGRDVHADMRLVAIGADLACARNELKVDSQQLQQLRPHILTSTLRDYESKVLIKRRLRVHGPHIMSTTSRQSNFEFDWEACGQPVSQSAG
eukprot:7602277-Pyramimonas_sp.AAC.1